MVGMVSGSDVARLVQEHAGAKHLEAAARDLAWGEREAIMTQGEMLCVGTMEGTNSPLSAEHLRAICRRRRIAEVEYSAGIDGEAELTARPEGGFAIRISRRERTARARYS